MTRIKTFATGVVLTCVFNVSVLIGQQDKYLLAPTLGLGYGEFYFKHELSGRLFTLGLQFPRTERRIIEFEGRFWYREQADRLPPVNGLPAGLKRESGALELLFKRGWRVWSWKFIEFESTPFVKAYWLEADYDPYSPHSLSSSERRIGLGLGGEIRSHIRIEKAVSVFGTLSYSAFTGYYQRYVIHDPTLLSRERISKRVVFDAFNERMVWTVGLNIKLILLDRKS